MRVRVRNRSLPALSGMRLAWADIIGGILTAIAMVIAVVTLMLPAHPV